MTDDLLYRLRLSASPGGYSCDECNGECAGGPCIFVEAADTIEGLLLEIEKYRHAAFIIGETCVEADKMHITPEAALQKIRENIYYSRHD